MADQVVESYQFGPHRSRPLGGQVRVISNDAHTEGQRPLGHQRSDAAEPHDPEGFAVQLDSLPTRSFPAAGFQSGVGLRDVAGLGEQEGEGVLGGGQDVRLRSVHDNDTPARGGRDVHVVEADPGPAHHLQMAPGDQYLVGHAGGRADY